MNFDKLLEDGFANSNDAEATRLEYLSDYIFDFTTYDREKAEEFAIVVGLAFCFVCWLILKGD